MNAKDDTRETERLIEEIGADAIDLCCRYQVTSAQYGIDLETQTYAALDVLARGGTLEDAVACIDDAHPFAHKVKAELRIAASRFAWAGPGQGGAQSPLTA